MIDQRMSLAALSLALTLALAAALPQGRLLGGEDAKAAEFPYVASLRLNKAHVCQAAIISQTQMLTAAHCVSDVGANPVSASDLSARVGSINQFAGGELVDISEVLIHPSYGNFLHDLAILTLSKPLTFGEKVNKIELPAAPEEGSSEVDAEEQPPNGTPVYVAGWGEQADGSSNYKLQKSNLNTLSKSQCELSAGYGYDSVLCLSRAEKQGVCRGDAGAAVVDDDNVLLGVVSFFWGNCGTIYPDVSTRISYYISWIEANKK
ncbi:chymotrypsin-1 [Drosophila virilis]|uniref:chymotrypsin-1 n=1 Tax=Drosophila virilis TaxID=7244 RepID=UPI00017D4F50|nr:chymotrypsin-1 [Drosophila virilis]